jgi:hypothetical protein
MDGLSKRTRSIRDAIANQTFEAGQLTKASLVIAPIDPVT